MVTFYLLVHKRILTFTSNIMRQHTFSSFLFTMTICLFSVLNANATKRALVIGIGSYPQGSGFSKINGDRDVPVVTDMLTSLGFKKSDITALVNQNATFDNIQSAFRTLSNISELGDIIYIHFSGHGQQITDLNGDEEDGLDEAWIPFDAQAMFKRGIYEGEHHITDDMLNGWLTSINKKIGNSGNLIVIADACHSGDSTRDIEDEDEQEKEITRGIFENFIINVYNKLTDITKPKYSVDWINISACKSYQVNYEYRKENVGSLTYAIFQNKDKLLTTPADEFIEYAQETIDQIIKHTQTLVLDGSEKSKQQILIY